MSDSSTYAVGKRLRARANMPSKVPNRIPTLSANSTRGRVELYLAMLTSLLLAICDPLPDLLGGRYKTRCVLALRSRRRQHVLHNSALPIVSLSETRSPGERLPLLPV